jgi:hypothetical protein
MVNGSRVSNVIISHQNLNLINKTQSVNHPLLFITYNECEHITILRALIMIFHFHIYIYIYID